MDPSPQQPSYDAVVIGSGPNGLAAAIQLAQHDQRVLVLEAKDSLGGGSRSAARTLPGFTHDVCSAIHPLALASPYFQSLPLEAHGVEWIHPIVPVAHPLDDDTAVLLHRGLSLAGEQLGPDGPSYSRTMRPLLDHWRDLVFEILGPLRIPRHPITLARFGLSAIRSAKGFAQARFKGARARALFAGMAGHSMRPLEKLGTAAFGLTLGLLAHAVGWPMAKGGSQSIADALAQYLRSLGGEIITNRHISSMEEIPPSKAVLFDLTPRQILQIAGDELPAGLRRQLGRFRYGPGIFKLDWALDGPIPWRAEECAQAGTVHIGGTLEEISAAEQSVSRGEHPDHPFVILAQQSLFDLHRAPEGKHTAWAYCHVPNGSQQDMTAQIEAQIERFAPGFKERVLDRAAFNTREVEAYNPNYIGGDINGGIQDLRQQFTRPTPRLDPYKLSEDGLYICSSSTPPGGGVHGMCGFYAARSALRTLAN